MKKLLFLSFVLASCSQEPPKSTVATAAPSEYSPSVSPVLSPEQQQRQAPVPSPDITLSQYKGLAPGMSYKAAVELLGSEGTELSSNDIGGTHTAMYQWKAKDNIANLNATFQNNKLVTKAQYGLQ